MRRPAVRLTVGELVLDGVPVADGDRFGAAVAGELARLVERHGLPDRPAAPAATAPPPEVRLAAAGPSDDDALARQVASAVWQAIGGTR